jgi:predicted phosphoribosyltransferase
MLKESWLKPWRTSSVTFVDRADAGRRLGAHFTGRHLENPLVLALPRGGVEVGFEVALALHAPLDVIPARKLGALSQPELAIGAIAPDAVILNDRIIAELGLEQDDIDRATAQQRVEMERQAALFRSGRPPLDLAGKTVILVDDGLATGATASAAIASIRRHHPRKVILAVPVGARDTVARLQHEADQVLCLETPWDFRSVGQWYADFQQTTDERVVELLRRAGTLRPEVGTA